MIPILTPLAEIETPNGKVRHALKEIDHGFSGFAEAYFSEVLHGHVKGWKMHLKMHMNLIVPVGTIKFYVRKNGEMEQLNYVLGDENYQRLTIPPHYWVAFEGIGKGRNILLNVADVMHDPEEAMTESVDKVPLG